MQAVVDDDVELTALENPLQAIVARDELVVLVQLGPVLLEGTASDERAPVLLEVSEVDVETDQARGWEQVAPDREASTFEDAKLGDGKFSGSKERLKIRAYVGPYP